MLPVVRGGNHTRAVILAYTVMLVILSLLPYAFAMSGFVYVIAASLLGLWFIGHAHILYKHAGNTNARLIRYSIFYLFALFAALLFDHCL